MKKLILISILFLLNACATYTLVEKEEKVEVNNLYAFKSKLALSEIRMTQGSKLRVFTNNGQGLESFFFSTDVYPGTPLSKISGKELKKYRKDMNNIDFVEFITSSLVDYGMINGKLVDVSEVDTDVGKFRRFFVIFQDKTEGLNYKSIIDRHENLEILRVHGFIAPEKYYYDKYIADYNYMVESLIKIN